MYYQNYEDYMRKVLGYPISDTNIYETYDYRNNASYEDTYTTSQYAMTNMSENEIRNCYPEIYHLVYPMVCKICDTNTETITRDLIEKMTDEVYNAIEDHSTVVNVRVETKKADNISSSSTKADERSIVNENSSLSKSSSIYSKSNRVDSSRSKLETSRTKESELMKKSELPSLQSSRVSNVKETRQINAGLRDLITILILQRLFGGRRIGFPNRPRPPRPPFPGGPGGGRPPFPGGPGGPNPRPPFPGNRTSEYTNYLEF